MTGYFKHAVIAINGEFQLCMNMVCHCGKQLPNSFFIFFVNSFYYFFFLLRPCIDYMKILNFFLDFVANFLNFYPIFSLYFRILIELQTFTWSVTSPYLTFRFKGL